MRTLIAVALIIFAPGAARAADQPLTRHVTVGLKDGQGTVRGQLLSAGPASITVKTDDGEEETIPQSKVSMVLDDNGDNVEVGESKLTPSPTSEALAPAADPAVAAKKVAEGNRFFMGENFDGAIAAFQAALAADVRDVPALKGLAACYEEKGDLAKSLEYTKAAQAAAQPISANVGQAEEPMDSKEQKQPELTRVATPMASPTRVVSSVDDSADDDDLAAINLRLRQLRRHRAELLAQEREEERKNDRFGYELTLGYTYVNLDRIADASPLHNAFEGGLDLNADCLQGHLSLGPRVRYIASIDTENQSGMSWNGSTYQTYTGTYQETYQVVPIMLGLQYRSQTWAQIQLGLGAGYALAYIDESWTFMGDTSAVNFSGGAPVAEATLGLRLGRRSFHVGLEAGYRYLVVSQMKSGDGGLMDGGLTYDFGGASGSLELSQDF